MKSRSDPIQEDADTLLSLWGSNYFVLLHEGFYPSISSGCISAACSDPSDSNPTYHKVKNRQHLMFIDAAVRALPEQPRNRLYEEYVLGRRAADCGRDRGVRMERDAARLAFWSVYQDRRRLTRPDTTGRGSEVA